MKGSITVMRMKTEENKFIIKEGIKSQDLKIRSMLRVEKWRLYNMSKCILARHYGMKWNGKTRRKHDLEKKPPAVRRQARKWQIHLHVFGRSQVWKTECGNKTTCKQRASLGQP